MRAVVMKSAGWVTHVLAGLQSNFLGGLPCPGPLTREPRPLDHDAMPLVGMRMRPAHDSRGKPVDREIEAGLRRVALEHRGLHAELVVLGRRPLELVDIEPDELARRKRPELRL